MLDGLTLAVLRPKPHLCGVMNRVLASVDADQLNDMPIF